MPEDILSDKNIKVTDVITPPLDQNPPLPPPPEKSSAVWRFFSIRPENSDVDEPLVPGATGSRKSFLRRSVWKTCLGAALILLIAFVVAKADLGYKAKFIWSSWLAGKNYSIRDSGVSDGLPAKSEGEHLESFIADIAPVWQGGLETLSQFKSLITLSTGLTGEINWLMNNGSTQFLKGGELCGHLDKIKGYLVQVEERASSISTGNVGIADPRSLVPFRVSVNRARQFLDSFLSWSKSKRHLVVLLQNNSELRPTAGFIGSYADLNIENCVLKNFIFRDVNEVDRGLPDMILPPRPVQTIARTFRVADANWFENFPESAELLVGLMDSSSLYKNPDQPVDGVLAITPKVVEDILSVAGPISLPDGRKISADDFLTEFQKEVQSGQADKDPRPKNILSEALAALVKKIADSENGEMAQSFLAMAPDWVEKRDVVVYLEDKDLENFIDSVQASGRLFDTPTDWNGSYLSVALANLGGGKSDLYMSDKVDIQAQLDQGGVWSTHFVLNSKHNGDKAKDWWYKERNERFVRILVPKGAKLVGAEGVWARGPEAYKTPVKDSVKNPMIAAWEESKIINDTNPGVFSYSESGKTAFGFWTKTETGKNSQVSLDYSEQAYARPVSGTVYHFMLERQPGWSARYNLEISAPPGFTWRENNSPLYKVSWDDSSPARNSVELTLEKI